MQDGFIYHIYPLGLCGAPTRNNFYAPVNHRIEVLYHWIEHLKNLGVTAVYLGPLFESNTHGYDTYDYYHVDRRLGDRQSLAKVIRAFHSVGIKVIVDAVFNHVGRDFWAFRDVLRYGERSQYCNWFKSLKFGARSPFGDPFTYKAWKKHYSLVKLNLSNAKVREHLFKAVEMWIKELGVDGVRLDAADCLTVKFIRDLKKYCTKIKPDFWLLGEIVHGDYRKKTNDKMLHSVTNYQAYNELYSSFNKKNFSVLSTSLDRQFGSHGIYKHMNLYSFLDNHDVNRIASNLKNQAHLYPMYALLFTIPGIPSIYYGSEFGIQGKRTHHSDSALRPNLSLSELYKKSKHLDLLKAIKKFATIRKALTSLQGGGYQELFVSGEQFAFLRYHHKEYTIVIINSASDTRTIDLKIPFIKNAKLIDVLNNNEEFYIRDHGLRVNNLWANWAKILRVII